MTACAFVIPGDINLPTGGYAYDRQVLARLATHGIAATYVALPGSYPDPTPEDLAETERRLVALPAATTLLFDGLAYGALPGDVVGRIKQHIVALVHHPLCLEAGLAPMRARYLQQTEQMALMLAAHVVVTSPMTGRTLFSDFAVPPSKVTVAVPGTDRAARAHGTGRPLQLLAVGSIVPRKGYDVLAHALRDLAAEPDWHLTIVGAVRHEGAAAALIDALKDDGADGKPLLDRVTLTGAVDDTTLANLYAATDVFVMPSLFEGYGMVLAEAMARGLPIICTTGGAAVETAPDAAALKVPPGNAAAFGAALGELLSSEPLRRHMSDASWTAGQTLPTWDDTTRTIAEVIRTAN